MCTSRYCSQNKFDLILVGGQSERTGGVVRNAFNIDANNLSNKKSLLNKTQGRHNSPSALVFTDCSLFHPNSHTMLPQ